MSAKSELTTLQQNSLSSVIAREIEGWILRGKLPMGERINEMQLADAFGVSRSPVREALRVMEAAGLVEALPNRGIYVRHVDTALAIEVYGVRAALFGYAGQLVAERATDGDRRELRGLHEAMSEAAASHSFEAYFPMNFAFHGFIVDTCGNAVLAGQYRALVKQLRLFRARNLMSGNTIAVSHAEHATIVEAIEARDPAAAYRACFEHVEQGKQRVMIHTDTEGEALSSDGLKKKRAAMP
jgi:DNA-binding GntR family transcriptional regulator